MLERAGVGERIPVLHRQAVNDVAYRELGEFAGERAREVGYRDDSGGNVARGGVGADGRADLLLQWLIELCTAGQAHEQYDTDIAVPVLPHRQRLGNLRQALDRRVDLRGADAHPARIEHRIRATVDDETIVPGDGGVVAVVPHPGEALEVGGPVSHSLRVVPEPERHRGEWRGAHQLPALTRQRPARSVEDIDRHAEAATLD